VHFWNSVTGVAQQTLRDRTDLVRALAVSLNSKKVVLASDDGTTQLWDTKAGEIL
jgi:WD40 repeat protein